MGFSTVIKQSLLDLLFDKGTFTPPTNIKLAASATTPTATGTNVTEPSTGDYARVVTTPADWTAASAEEPTKILNAAAIVFPTATADWLAGADITCIVLFDQNDVYLGYGPMVRNKPIYTGDILQFDISNFYVTLGG